MAFILPTFNLTCNVFTNADFTAAPRATLICGLAMGRRQAGLFNNFTGAWDQFSDTMQLLLEAGADVRDGFNGPLPDGVEAPAGSGRYYLAVSVDDSGKGYANEHRVAFLVKTLGPGDIFWPTPIP